MSTKHQDEFLLSERDKARAPHGYGSYFAHATPQRRVPCVLGDMLAPLSADDIPPISPEAMASVQAAIRLLANLVGDRDHRLYLAINMEGQAEARSIANVAAGLAGILRLRVTSPEGE